MENRNNLGRQFTQRPNFGAVYPNTQYKGYYEAEEYPYGNPSVSRNIAISNQPSYTSRYQGHNPNHSEDRFSNVKFHGNYQTGQPNLNTPQSGINQYQNQTSYNPGMAQTSSQYQGNLQQYPEASFSGQRGVNQDYSTTSSYQGGMNQFASNPSQAQRGINQFSGQNQLGGTVTQGQPNMTQTQFSQTQGTQRSSLSQSPVFNDRDRINDLLASEKYLTEGYNVSTFEATNPELQNTLRNILTTVHNNRETLHQLMEQRGWYKTDNANQQQITQAYNQFTEYKSQLPFS